VPTDDADYRRRWRRWRGLSAYRRWKGEHVSAFFRPPAVKGVQPRLDLVGCHDTAEALVTSAHVVPGVSDDGPEPAGVPASVLGDAAWLSNSARDDSRRSIRRRRRRHTVHALFARRRSDVWHGVGQAKGCSHHRHKDEQVS